MKHYVYRHIRHDLNVPFYIGKATISKESEYRRAKHKAMHNESWYDVVSKTGYDVDILYHTDSEKEALEKEIEFIKLYGRIDNGTGTLVNRTDGGYGIERLIKMNKTRVYKDSEFDGLREYWKNNGVKIYQYSLKGEFLKEWPNAYYIKRAIGGFSSNFLRASKANNKDGTPTTYKGFIWRASKDNFALPIVKDTSKRNKKILQFDSNGNFIKEWDNHIAIKKELGFESGNISRACRVNPTSRKPKTCYGFIWKYKTLD